MPGIGIILSALGFFKGVGGANPVKTWATILLIALLSFGAGNVVANHRAIATARDEAEDRSAREMAAATGALIKRAGEQKVASKVDAQLGRKVDDHAFATLRATAASADRAKAAALKALSDERQRRTMEAANAPIADTPAACPAADPFSWPGSVRVLLDAAAGAGTGVDPADRAAGAAPAGRAPGASAASGEPPRLTPDDVAQGYSVLGPHDRVCRGRLTALQDWVLERFLDR